MKKALIVIGIVIVVGIFVIVFSLPQKEKLAITSDTYITTMKDKGYVIYDVTSSYANYGSYMLKAYLAIGDGHQITFFELSTPEHAIGMYNTNKEKIESQKSSTSSSTTVSKNNYSKYSLNTNGKYKYLSRIDNTLIYIDVFERYKDTVKDIMEEIGY